MAIPAHRRQRHRHLCSVSPRTYWVFWLVQPFATIEEKACFGLFLSFNQGMPPWLPTNPHQKGLQMANSAAQRRKIVRENTSGNFVPISGELARTWTLATAF